MSLVQLEGVSKSFGTEALFERFSAVIGRGDRIALVGDNGVGKSTLLSIIAGEERPTEGEVRTIGNVWVGHLSQAARLRGEGTLREAMERPFSHLLKMEAELRSLEERIADSADEEALRRYDDLLHRFAAEGGYTIEARIRSTLAGVGFAEDALAREVATLSGGEEARAALASVLAQEPDLLLLDEPTNHLDFAALDWLEERLLTFPGGLVLVSHDRHLLNRVSNRTWEIAFGEVAVYPVGYTASRELRAAEHRRRLELYERQEEEIERHKDFIRRHHAGQKHRQAKDREKKLKRIERERIEAPKEGKRIALSITIGHRSGRRVLSLHDLAIGYDRPLFSIPRMELHRGEKIAIIGPNGCGKTTLMKTIMGEVRPLSGRVEIGHNVQIAAFRQTQEDLHGEESVLDAVLKRTDLTIGEARGLLGRFLFSGDGVMKKTKSLSGGERSRLALALLSLIEGNLLLLDEPTNHLDPASQEILERALIEYEGTLLLVSHDRSLLEAVTTGVWIIERGRFVPHSYGYSEYRRRMRESPAEGGGPEKKGASRSRVKPGRKAAGQERYRLRRIEEERRAVEERIEALEERIADLEGGLIEASTEKDADRIASLGAEYERLRRELSEEYAAWESLVNEWKEEG